MKNAILRGIDFPATEADDQIRFCNPLLSFEQGASASIYLARDLDWNRGDDHGARLLTPVDIDEVDSFGTLFPRATLHVSQGEGVVLMGERFVAAARVAGIAVDHVPLVEFTDLLEFRCWIGVAGIGSFRDFAGQLAREASSVFDDVLSATVDGELPKRGEAALFVLRKCGAVRPTDLALRQLAAASVTHQTDVYRRLLIRFSIELGETEENLDRRVQRHIRVARPTVVIDSQTRPRTEHRLYPLRFRRSYQSFAAGREKYTEDAFSFTFKILPEDPRSGLEDFHFYNWRVKEDSVSLQTAGAGSVLPVSTKEKESRFVEDAGKRNRMRLLVHHKDTHKLGSTRKMNLTHRGVIHVFLMREKTRDGRLRDIGGRVVEPFRREEFALRSSKSLESGLWSSMSSDEFRSGSDSRSSITKLTVSEGKSSMYRQGRGWNRLAYVQMDA